MIDWSFLLKVLQARVFDDGWCGLIRTSLSPSFSSVLVNVFFPLVGLC